jgi:hypothetical protein
MLGTLTVHECAAHTGLRLSFMQFVHNFIRITCLENTSSKRAMMPGTIETHWWQTDFRKSIDGE